MSRADRILGYFPSVYRAGDRTKLLREVVESLAQPLEEADTLLFRIQRAHRLKVAEQTGDIVRLAAALNLRAFHFEDILADQDLSYDERLALMRERVWRVARVHLSGLGTPWAVVEAAAIFLNATVVPERPGDPLVKHLDAGGFSHQATVEFGHLPGKPRERVYLHENPLLRRKVQPAERWPLASWPVANQNFEGSPVTLSIQGVGDRTVRPSILSPDTQEGLVFDGVVPDGKTLVVDRANGALLDKQPVDEWLIYYRGGIADFSAFDGASFAVEEGDGRAPFDGDLAAVAAPPYRSKRPVPTAPVGRSEWRFKVAEGVYDSGDFDYSVYATPAEPIAVYDGDFQLDGCVFDYPPSAVVGMAWDERVPCAFKLLLPTRVPQGRGEAGKPGPPLAASAGPEQPKPVDYVGRVGTLMPRFRPAGVRAYVDAARDAWVLGESVLRAPTAAGGEGVGYHSTRLRDPRADMFVQADNTP